MSQNRKWLKIASFAQVIIAVVAVIMAVGAANGEPAQGFFVAVPALGACGLHALGGLLSFGCAACGIRGANRPSNLGAHRVLAVLSSIIGIATIALLGMNAGSPVVPGLIAVLGIAATILDINVAKEADR